MLNARAWSLVAADNATEADKLFLESLPVAEQIVRELPNDSTVRAMLSEAYGRQDRMEEAQTQVRKALELNPSNPTPCEPRRSSNGSRLWGRGAWRARSWCGRFDECGHGVGEFGLGPVAEGQAFLAQEADGPGAAGPGRPDGRSGQGDRAAGEALGPEADDVQNLLQLAWVYENRDAVRDLDKAESYYRRAVEAQPSPSTLRPYLSFAAAHQRLAGIEQFLTEQAKKLAGDKKSEGYTLLATYYASVGRPDPAEEAFLEAAKVNDDQVRRMNLAIFYARGNRFEKAAEWAKKAFRITPIPRRTGPHDPC